MLDKLLGGFKQRHEVAKNDALEAYKQKLKKIVYDDDLVDELAPVFAQLHGTEGFDKVFDLLESKEKQIEAISGGEWFEQESDVDRDSNSDNKDDTAEQTETLTADEILAKKYETKE